MIITVEGKIGSGKTYWAVNFLVEKFYVWKEELFTYVPKGNLRVISNIKDLQLPHIDLDDEIEKRGGLEKVFNENYPGLKDANTQTIFVIDEAQAPNLFHRKYYNPAVFLFFQKSRHLGIDVVLITQDRFTLCKEIQTLSEYNVVAIPRSVRTKNVFMYKYVHGSEVGRRKSILFSKRIAGLYRSFEKLENEKVTYLWKKYALAMVIAVLVIGLGFKFAMGTFFNQGTKPSSGKGVFGQAGGGASSPTSTSKPAQEQSSMVKEYQDAWANKNGSKGGADQQKVTSYRKDGKAPDQPGSAAELGKVPDGSASTNVKVQGDDDRDKHEPLIPMKCQPPDSKGWQECFEGVKYVGRFKAISTMAPVYAGNMEPVKKADPKIHSPVESSAIPEPAPRK